MSISISCQCGRNILVSEELSGLPVRCPNCGRRHLVPIRIQEVEKAKVAPHFCKPVTTPNDKLCDKCNTVVPINSKFCNECGREFGKYPKPPFQQPKPPQKPEIHPHKPEAFPGPFRAGGYNAQKQNAPFIQQPPKHKSFHHHNHQNCCYEPQKDICIEVIKVEKDKEPKKTSGLAKFSFFSAFLGLLIVLIGVVILSAKSSSAVINSFYSLKIGFGMLHVGGIFTLIGIFTAFLALLHFKRKRFGIIFVSILFILASFFSAGAVTKSFKGDFGILHNNYFGTMDSNELIKYCQDNQLPKRTIERIKYSLIKELTNLQNGLNRKVEQQNKISNKINEIETTIKELEKILEGQNQYETEPIENVQPQGVSEEF